MAGFRQNHTKPSGCTELVDRMECWVIKVRWGPVSCRHNMDHNANKAFKPMTSAVYFEKELHSWTKPFYIVIEAVGGTFPAGVCVRQRITAKMGPMTPKAIFFFFLTALSLSLGVTALSTWPCIPAAYGRRQAPACCRALCEHLGVR